MATYTARFSEEWAVLDRIQIATWAGGISTDWVSMANYHRAAIVIDCGALGSTLDVAIWQATNLAGAGAKVVAGKNVTQLNGAADSNSHCLIELRTEELDVDGAFDCIRVQTISGAAGANDYGVTIYAAPGRFPPAATTNWDEVVD